MWLFLLACNGAPETSPPPPAEVDALQPPSVAPAESTVPQLPLDPDIPAIQPLPDRSAVAQARSAWDNFATRDTLNDRYDIRTKPPSMMLVATKEAYEEDPVGGILRDGKVNFWAVSELYRVGIISRDDQQPLLDELDQRLAELEGDASAKGNAIVGLIHIGFDEAALRYGERWKDEAWFAENFDVNFYLGSLHYRYRRYAEAVPFLRAALLLHPDVETRLWLASALAAVPGSEEERAELFTFGEHVGWERDAFMFTDISERLGIRRWQLAGAAAMVDLDGDSFLDLVANGAFSNPEKYLYEVGTGFVLTPDEALADVHNTPPGMVAADFDNDGDVDLYLTQAAWFMPGPNRLLENDGEGNFSDRSDGSGAELMGQNSCGAAALDFDKDGLVDLSVTGTMGGTVRLLRNTGGFRFEDVSASAGIDTSMVATAVGQAVGDFDGDGWPDVFVNTFSPPYGGVPGSGFTAPNQLYRNNGDGTFTERGAEAGVQDGTSMGFAAWAFDYDADGDMDILASNFARPEKTVVQGLLTELPWEQGYHGPALFRNDGTGTFENVAAEMGLMPASVMGATYLDFELDGDLDVVLGPGSHPLLNSQPVLFYRNDGSRFTLITPLDDPDYYGKFHGMTWGDIDRDGDADLFLNNGGVLLSDRFIDLFLENQTTDMAWLHLRLRGTTSNRDAIGAKVRVRVGDRWQTQEVAAGQGFSSTYSPYLIFGLAKAGQADEVEITWPSGTVQKLPTLAANQAIVVTEGSEELRRIY